MNWRGGESVGALDQDELTEEDTLLLPSSSSKGMAVGSEYVVFGILGLLALAGCSFSFLLLSRSTRCRKSNHDTRLMDCDFISSMMLCSIEISIPTSDNDIRVNNSVISSPSLPFCGDKCVLDNFSAKSSSLDGDF